MLTIPNILQVNNFYTITYLFSAYILNQEFSAIYKLLIDPVDV